MRRHAREAATGGVEDAREDDRKALKYGSAREASPDLAAGELEFTDDKVRVVVGLMFSLLDIFVEWGNGGGVQERAVVILTYFQDACHARQRVACILISSHARKRTIERP